LKRPSFRKLGLQRKVRYLSYEVVDEIDRFFEGSSQGLNVDVVKGRSEEIHIS